jgi:hypothetical protein
MTHQRRDGVRKCEDGGSREVAGRKLDALVAELVMGWTDAVISNYPFQFHYLPNSDPPYKRTPNFSTDIAAAWQVVEKMGASFDKLTLVGSDAQTWRCSVLRDGIFPRVADAPSAPLAICRAALACVSTPTSDSPTP